MTLIEEPIEKTFRMVEPASEAPEREMVRSGMMAFDAKLQEIAELQHQLNDAVVACESLRARLDQTEAALAEVRSREAVLQSERDEAVLEANTVKIKHSEHIDQLRRMADDWDRLAILQPPLPRKPKKVKIPPLMPDPELMATSGEPVAGD